VLHLDAFDWNCPQHIARRFDEADVVQAVGSLQARIEKLEAENRTLRENASKQPA
jgi:cell division protein FtsB